MPLAPDAKALLELILARGQSYEDIASLLEVPETEVRSRARAALTELGGADPDRNVALTDWVLGQADPITRADVARHVREDRDDHLLATELIAALREISPDADLPKVPGEPAAPRRPARDRPSRLTSLSSQQSRLLVILGSAAVLVVAIVLGVTGVFSGDDGSAASSSDTPADTTTADGTTPEDGATVPLEPVGGSDASGALTLGVANQTEPFINVVARDLQAPPSGSAYVIWFMQDEESGYPYQELQVTGSGDVSERFALPQELLGAALSSGSVDVWISPASKLQKLIPNALRDASVIKVPGERVLTADIQPIAQAAGLTQGGGETATPEQ